MSSNRAGPDGLPLSHVISLKEKQISGSCGKSNDDAAKKERAHEYLDSEEDLCGGIRAR